MEIIKVNKIGDVSVPAIKIIPLEYKGIVLVIHGYGGCKEEILGLSYNIAESGFLTYTIDLRGHGENEILYDENIIVDVNHISGFIRERGKKSVIIGHSIGGRLALTTDCNYSIGISPALNKDFSNQTQDIINSLRNYRVKEKYPGINFEILSNMTGFSSKKENTKILFGTRDVPEIMKKCIIMKDLGYDVVTIESALHNDIYLNKNTIEIIKNTLKIWFCQ